MKQTVSMEDLKASAGEIVNAVRLRGDRYIVSRYGKPAAAVVPLRVLEAYERNRERLFKVIDEVRAQNAGKDPEALENLVSEEVSAVRSARRRARRADKPAQ